MKLVGLIKYGRIVYTFWIEESFKITENMIVLISNDLEDEKKRKIKKVTN